MVANNQELKRVCTQCGEVFASNRATCPNDGAALTLAPPEGQDPYIGTALADKYEVVSLAGRGGMGVIYKARHRVLDRIVCAKFLRQDLMFDEKSYTRFQVEAVAASKLNHPNVIHVFDYGVTASGQPYLVMDFVEGTSLSKLIADNDTIDYRRAVPIFIQAASALEHAHQQSIIHRDVKPSNILLTEVEGQKDFVKLVDFGIAQLGMLSDEGLRLTQTGEALGSPLYMSPEQCTGETVDKRTDIYSLGVVMYEVLLGAPPIFGKSGADTIHKKITDDAKPFKLLRPHMSIPEALEAIVLKALQREPRKRFQSMQQLKNALEAAMKGVPVADMPEFIESEFAGIDLLKEVAEAKNISAEKLKKKGKAAKLLGAGETEKDEEDPTASIVRMRTIASRRAPLIRRIGPAAAAGVLVIAAVGCAAFLSFKNMNSQPAQSVKGIVSSADIRSKRNFSLRSINGKAMSFVVDNKTQMKALPRRGTNVMVTYTNKNGALHADKVLQQR